MQRLEPLYLALSPSHDLVGVLGPIIVAEPLVVTTGQMEFSERGAVGPQFVSHDQPGCEAVLSEEVAHELEGGALIASSLHQHIQELALVICDHLGRHHWHCGTGIWPSRDIVSGRRHVPAYPCLRRPRHLPWPAHPHEKPGFSTATCYFP
jgi:hypothetical protein